MEWTLGFAAIALLVIGLIGQAFEMRKIKQALYGEEQLGSPIIFTNKKNFKWYGVIGVGIVLWYIAERSTF